jgi:hypothetical protein
MHGDRSRQPREIQAQVDKLKLRIQDAVALVLNGDLSAA